jgi:hypothetical protein
MGAVKHGGTKCQNGSANYSVSAISLLAANYTLSAISLLYLSPTKVVRFEGRDAQPARRRLKAALGRVVWPMVLSDVAPPIVASTIFDRPTPLLRARVSITITSSF